MDKNSAVSSPDFIPLEGISKKLVLFLYLNLASDATSVVLTVARRTIAASIPPAQQEENLLYQGVCLLEGVAGLFEAIVYITATVLFCKWMYRAMINSTKLAPDSLPARTTPEAFSRNVIWSWFIPFLSLYKPYQHMKSLWKISTGGSNWKQATVPRTFGWWWFTWIIMGISGQVTFRSALKEGLEDLSDVSGLICSVVSILCALLVISIVRGITESQERRTAEVETPRR